ncbi:MAG: preprotein translocase subunit SecE [Moraxellaceae bacterium]|nr:preprotein translocase subunit SecE [Pseudobdellovibrionaceae bacterium]
MENTNSKYLTLVFIAASALVGFTVAALIIALSGAFAVIAKLVNYDLFKHGLPVIIAFGLFLFLQFNKGILSWADEVIAEIKKIVWPPIKDTRAMTVVVIIMIFISALIISVFDLFSGFALNQLIK